MKFGFRDCFNNRYDGPMVLWPNGKQMWTSCDGGTSSLNGIQVVVAEISQQTFKITNVEF